MGIPVILFDRVTSNLNCDKVVVDDKSGAEAATTFLINKGRKKILLLSTQDYLNVGNHRTNGYLDALKKNGIFPDNRLIIKCNDQRSSEEEMVVLEKQIEALIDEGVDFDGVFAVNEIYLAAALRVLRAKHIKVPKEVSMICFTDGVISRYTTPRLTTVSQHAEEMGITSAELLIEKLEDESSMDKTITKIIQCSIVEREST